jgi:hypothetical protein
MVFKFTRDGSDGGSTTMRLSTLFGSTLAVAQPSHAVVASDRLAARALLAAQLAGHLLRVSFSTATVIVVVVALAIWQTHHVLGALVVLHA